MKPIKFETSNQHLGAPSDWDAEKHGECAGLHVLNHEGVIYSVWKPSLKERLLIALGVNVTLSVCAPWMPAVAVSAGEIKL